MQLAVVEEKQAQLQAQESLLPAMVDRAGDRGRRLEGLQVQDLVIRAQHNRVILGVQANPVVTGRVEVVVLGA
jgi:hypothetical protein